MIMGTLWIANLVLIAISAIIFIAIIVSYVKSFRATNAKMFTGIIAFSSVLLAQSVTSLVIYYSLSLSFSQDLAGLLLVINALSLLGYVMLYRVVNV